MNFSSESVKHHSKTQNEDFYFDLETPRGHFFAVLDFGPHDFANLNATLKGKLETIVGSFVSLSRFSADLFLGFLAKEINNFLHNLREQAGGPELLSSAALCLVSGNRLTYFLCGHVGINIHNDGRILPLQGGQSEATGEQFEKLGGHNQEGPLSDPVQTFTLQDNDVVLIMTQGLEGAFEAQELSHQIGALDSSDPKLICDALMKASASSGDDRTLVVISGPYDRYVEPVLADLSKAVVSLEARLNSLADDQQKTLALDTSGVGAAAEKELENRLTGQIQTLKDELKGKAGRIDFLELEEKVENFGELLASKADTAEVLALQSDLLKLGIAVGARDSASKETTNARNPDVPASAVAGAEALGGPQRSFLSRTALLALVIGLAAGFIGAWLQSRTIKKQQEVWSVKTAGNQVLISRLDGGSAQGTITLNVSLPLQSTEQNFSSFADVKRYIDTVTAPDHTSQTTPPDQAPDNNAAAEIAEITVKPGDSLRKIAQQHNVSEQQIMVLNPTIKRWSSLRSGQRVIVPSRPPANAPASPQASPVTSSSVPGTIEVSAEPGDSINRFALRYKTTPERLRELNPNITNWTSIQIGQKVLVPTPPSG